MFIARSAQNRTLLMQHILSQLFQKFCVRAGGISSYTSIGRSDGKDRNKIFQAVRMPERDVTLIILFGTQMAFWCERSRSQSNMFVEAGIVVWAMMLRANMRRRLPSLIRRRFNNSSVSSYALACTFSFTPPPHVELFPGYSLISVVSLYSKSDA